MNSDKQKSALVIGVSDYPNHSGFRQLPFCRNDGMDMCSLLTELGYSPFGDPKKLIGHVEYEDMRVQIDDFLVKDAYGPDDTLILYFSGHGFVDNKGNGYMCCSDM
jgi:hypothetical protein